MRPLNPALYAALIGVFGTVDVRNECQTASRNDDLLGAFGTSFGPAPHKAGGRVPEFGSGESYRTPCSFCDDPGRPLFINHRRGGAGPAIGRPDLRPAGCLTALAPGGTECLLAFGRRKALFDVVFSPVPRTTARSKQASRRLDANTTTVLGWFARRQRWPRYEFALLEVEAMGPAADRVAGNPGLLGLEPAGVTARWGVAGYRTTHRLSGGEGVFTGDRKLIRAYTVRAHRRAQALTDPPTLQGWVAPTLGPVPAVVNSMNLRNGGLVYAVDNSLEESWGPLAKVRPAVYPPSGRGRPVVVVRETRDAWRLGGNVAVVKDRVEEWLDLKGIGGPCDRGPGMRGRSPYPVEVVRGAGQVQR